MTTNTNAQKNNHSSMKEKGDLFCDLSLDITSINYLGLTEKEVIEKVRQGRSNRGEPKVSQDIIERLAERYWRLNEQLDDSEEWDKYWQEFRAFLRKIGITLRDFDNAVRKSTYPSTDRSDFLRFLVAYYLIATEKASTYVTDDAYQTIADNAFCLFTTELYQMSDDLNHVLHCTAMGFGDLLDGKNEPLAPNVSVMGSGFLHFFMCRGKTVMTKAAAVFATPYAWYMNCESEEWVGYLFYFRGTEIFPKLRRILSALLDEVKGTEQLENKPLV